MCHCGQCRVPDPFQRTEGPPCPFVGTPQITGKAGLVGRGAVPQTQEGEAATRPTVQGRGRSSDSTRVSKGPKEPEANGRTDKLLWGWDKHLKIIRLGSLTAKARRGSQDAPPHQKRRGEPGQGTQG